jgi:hypothetical protein
MREFEKTHAAQEFKGAGKGSERLSQTPERPSQSEAHLPDAGAGKTLALIRRDPASANAVVERAPSDTRSRFIFGSAGLRCPMQEIEEFVDERNKSWCIHCGWWLTQLDTNEDHVPSKSFLQKPHPHHLPVVTVCKPCNSGFSRDEQYFVAFLSSVLAGSTDPTTQTNASATRSLSKSPKLRERIDRSSSTYRTAGGETRIIWKPEIDRVNRVILKNARGHAYFRVRRADVG